MQKIKNFAVGILFLFCVVVGFSQKDTTWTTEAKVGDTISLFHGNKIVLKDLRIGNKDSTVVLLDKDLINISDSWLLSSRNTHETTIMLDEGYNIGQTMDAIFSCCTVGLRKIINKKKQIVQIEIIERCLGKLRGKYPDVIIKG